MNTVVKTEEGNLAAIGSARGRGIVRIGDLSHGPVLKVDKRDGTGKEEFRAFNKSSGWVEVGAEDRPKGEPREVDHVEDSER